MNQRTSLRWGLAWLLIFLLGGCYSYTQLGVVDDPAAANLRTWQDKLIEGDFVRLTLRSGETVQGTIDVLDDEGIQFQKEGNYGFLDRAVAWADVARVELRDATDGEIEIAWWSTITLGLVAGVIYAFSQIGGS